MNKKPTGRFNASVKDTRPCPRCTTDNSMDSTTCDVCLYVNNRLRQAPAPTPLTEENHPEYVEGTGVCPRCTFQNAADAAWCATCGENSFVRCQFCGTKNIVGAEFCTGKRFDAGFEQRDFDGGLSRSYNDDDAYQQAEYTDEPEYGVSYIRPPPRERRREYEMSGGLGP
jgi:ribosomal protein L40E